MTTLSELLGEEETFDNQASSNRDELHKLAAEIGLVDETEYSSDKTLIKEASPMLHDLYQEMFPGDVDVVGQEKLGSFEKEAAEIEEAMGAYAYDVFQDCVQGHIEKIAAALVEAHVTGETHPQSMDNNEDDSEDAIDTDGNDGAEGVAAMGTSPRGAVGDFMMHGHPNGEQIKAAAFQKHLLRAQLGL